jgi:hypothetical protein
LKKERKSRTNQTHEILPFFFGIRVLMKEKQKKREKEKQKRGREISLGIQA